MIVKDCPQGCFKGERDDQWFFCPYCGSELYERDETEAPFDTTEES